MELGAQTLPEDPLLHVRRISGVSPQSPAAPRKREKPRPPYRGSGKFAGVKISDFPAGQKSAR